MSYQFDKQNFWDYIINMKTSIKVPESLYSEVERIAADLGIPGSQVFTEALEDFIKKHAKENITEKLNRVYENYTDSNDEIDLVALEAIRKLTKNDSW